MYFGDLTQYEYLQEATDQNALNVGWLDDRHTFPKCKSQSDFLDRLFDICRFPVNKTRGYHQCPFCKTDGWGLRVGRNDQEILLGGAEIRVRDSGGVVYAAPDLVYHYIADHDYCPPSSFTCAVLG